VDKEGNPVEFTSIKVNSKKYFGMSVQAGKDILKKMAQ
jgi:hypothetical protein